MFETVTEQTGYIRGANWYGQLLVALSCWFVEHVSHASFSSAESTVTSSGLQRGDKFSPRPTLLISAFFSPEGRLNLRGRWRDVSCFWKKLGTHVLGTICVSQILIQQGRQTVNCRLLLSNRRFSGSDSIFADAEVC